MNGSSLTDAERSTFLLRFESLFGAGRGYTFPCDATGHVDMNLLSDTARQNYLYARAVVGRELSRPRVVEACVAS